MSNQNTTVCFIHSIGYVQPFGKQITNPVWPLSRLALQLLLLLTIVPVVLLSSPLHTDAQSFSPSHVFFGGGSDNTRSVAVGDMNGDGYFDIVVGNDYQKSAVYLNDRTGSFDQPDRIRTFSNGKEQISSVALGDLDGDGDLDIVAGIYWKQQNAIYFNDGLALPSFDKTRYFGTNSKVWSSSVALGDMNGDGYLDIVVGYNSGLGDESEQSDRQSMVYLNDGKGNFDWPGSTISFGGKPYTTDSVVVGDINSDGHLDIVTSGFGARTNTIYLNDGLNPPSFNQSISIGHSGKSVALGDLNGDGRLDIVAGGAFSLTEVYLNNKPNNRNDPPSFSGPISFGSSASNTQSFAFGDMNGDGSLDIITGNDGYDQQNKIYFNDKQNPPKFGSSTNFGTGVDRSYSVAVADMNGDGGLDIVTGNFRQQNVVYLNTWVNKFEWPNGILQFGTAPSTEQAVGDMNGDGYLDIIVGNQGIPHAIYLNNGLNPPSFGVTRNFGQGKDAAAALAVGDMNGDDQLDIVVGNRETPNTIYLNDGLNPPSFTHIAFGKGDLPASIAVGDMNSDGHLDIVVGNQFRQSKVYLNDGHNPPSFVTERAFGAMSNTTNSLALGDMNGDGQLDIVVGNTCSDMNQYNKIYLNDGLDPPSFSDIHNFGTGCDFPHVAVGDMNSDGYLDIVEVNDAGYSASGQNIVYLNDGNGRFDRLGKARYFGSGGDRTFGVAIGDINGDGYLDIIAGNLGQSAIYLNDGRGNFDWPGGIRNFGSTDNTRIITTGDMNNDGRLDFVTGSIQNKSAVYLNQPTANALTGNPLKIAIARPGLTHNANFFSTPKILNQRLIPINYTLFAPKADKIGHIEAFYSLDGGGNWKSAIASNTITTNLESNPIGVTHVYTWDTFASNFFGQSDNMIVRMIIYPQQRPTGVIGTYRYTNTIPGPYQWPYASASTFPFRARGTQVQIYKESVAAGNQLNGAFVYRLQEQQSMAKPMPDTENPLQTDGNGYLQGHGELQIGDRLVALWPVTTSNAITFTENYVLYYTSAKPGPDTLEMGLVSNPGVQVLTVSADNKLLLFNLDVALEWDARKDAQFMEQLRFNLQRTSQLLFDWSNGQAALGQVRIFHDAKRNTSVAGFHPWADSHIRIYATNRMRPSAAEGGIISPTLEVSETVQGKLITYGPGQVHIGALWNRYGESSGALGEDWPRALAHELGHYLFFLEDDYLGFDTQGRLVTVPAEGDAAHSCPGVMNDPYRESQSEFQPEPGWTASGCIQTLAQQTTGRADWQTISHFYKNTFITPTVPFGQQNPGPSILPLTVTQLQVISPTMPTQTVAVPIFYLTKAGGGTYVPGPNAQAYLFQGDWLTDLGQPTLDQVQAWGARPHDRLCVYEAAAGYQGCVRIQPPVDQVALQQVTPWQPTIVVSPVSSRTIALQVTTALNAGQLAARLYPTDAPAPTCILLQPTEPNQYAGTFPTLAEPALDGYVHLWVQTANTPCTEPQATAGQETVTGYAIGGNPVHRRSRRTLSRGSGVHRRSRRAPAISADGQVMVFGDALDLNQEQEWFFTLQATSDAPAIPPGRTLVGQAYRLTASPNAPKLTDASISFGYLGDQVPAGEERFLQIYFWTQDAAACQPQAAPCWQRLSTFVDPEYNVTSAKTQGPGLYALLASLEVPLTNVGWNNFAYPVPGTQPVAEALAAIDGAYTVVYGYQPTNATDSWLVYSPSAPDWVNDLKELAFGQGYWLYATQAITLYLQGDDSTRVTAAAGVTSTATSYGSTRVTAATGLTPPATFYGAVQTTSDFTPQVGMEVTAWIDQQVCGRSQVQKQGDALVYVIKVVAEDGSAHAGCGADGRTVSFQVNGVTMLTQGAWDNTQIWDLSLTTQLTNQAFLPLCSTNARQALHEAGNSSENHLLLPWINQ